MASLRKRKGSRYWVGCFTLPNGERRQCSTKERDKSKALQIVLGWERVAKSQATVDQARRVLADIVSAVSGEQMVDVNAREYVETWFVTKSPSLAEQTVTRYRALKKDFIKFLPEKLAFSQVKKGHLVAFRDAIALRTSPENANNSLKIVKTIFNEAHQDGKILENPAATVRRLKEKKEKPKKPFTLAQESALLHVEDRDEAMHGMALFGSYTGQRMKDVSEAVAEAINENHVWEFVSSKTGRTMMIPLAQPLIDWIQERKITSGLLFPELQGKTSSTLSGMFYRHMVKAGLVPKRNGKAQLGIGKDGKRTPCILGYHSYRHSLTTKLKSGKVTDVIAREFVGHDSKAVSQGYTHLPIDVIRDAAKALPIIK